MPSTVSTALPPVAGSAGRAGTGTGTASGSSGTPSAGMSSINNKSWVLDNIITNGLTEMGEGIVEGIDKGINGMMALTSTRDRRVQSTKKKKMQTEASRWRAMKNDFLEEMRYLSKLRHPCITTVSFQEVGCGVTLLKMIYLKSGGVAW